jgi:pectin-derived oligosaccharide transport system substrate-binding protein
MNSRLTRRQFGGLIASGASLAVLASTSRRAFADTRLRYIWWGNPDRDKRTKAMVALYETKNPGVTISAETYGWNDYWTKLATQAAGGNLPDVIQMDYRYIFEWARRGQLADLTPFLGSDLHMENFDKNVLDAGKVDGKLYGISMGANSIAVIYSVDKLKAAGGELPDSSEWTWDDYRKIGTDVKSKLPDGVYFSANMGSWEPLLQCFLRQRGKDLYTADGQLGFDATDLGDFWNYWMEMQNAGLTPPPDVQAQDKNGPIETQMISAGRAVFDYTNSNQLVGMQNLNKDKLDLAMFPNQPGLKAGQYLKPSMFMSQRSNSSVPDEAAKFINFAITDLDAADILQIERGVPSDSEVIAHIAPSLSPTEQQIIAYLKLVATHVSPLPPAPPKGAGEVDVKIIPAWQAVSFGKISVADAANDFVNKAADILKRS